jgi:hypothetical protein
MKYALALLAVLLLLAFAPVASVMWTEIVGKPSTFPPAAHDHDERYYTKSMQNRSFLPSSYKPDWMALLNRPTSFAPTAHTHDDRYYLKAQSDAAYLPSSYLPAWANLTGKPATFAPSSHSHVTDDMPGLGAVLAGYVTTSDGRLTDARTPVSHTHVAAQITDFAQALNANITSTSLVHGTLIKAGNIKIFCSSGTVNANSEYTVNLTLDGTPTGTSIFSKILANWTTATVNTITLPNDVVTGCVRSESLTSTTLRYVKGQQIIGTLLNAYGNAPTGTPVRAFQIGI